MTAKRQHAGPLFFGVREATAETQEQGTRMDPRKEKKINANRQGVHQFAQGGSTRGAGVPPVFPYPSGQNMFRLITRLPIYLTVDFPVSARPLSCFLSLSWVFGSGSLPLWRFFPC